MRTSTSALFPPLATVPLEIRDPVVSSSTPLLAHCLSSLNNKSLKEWTTQSSRARDAPSTSQTPQSSEQLQVQNGANCTVFFPDEERGKKVSSSPRMGSRKWSDGPQELSVLRQLHTPSCLHCLRHGWRKKPGSPVPRSELPLRQSARDI